MRSFVASLLAVSLVLPGGAFAAKPRQMSKEQQVDHALNRLTWGPEPGEAAGVRKLGVKKWIDRQLQPQSISEDPDLQARLDAMPVLKADTAEMFEKFKDRKSGAIRPAVQNVVEARFLRAVYTNRQLEDVLTDFWFNHFNVFMDKGADRVFVGPYERDAIRPFVLGKFRDMLEATASHPAMLWYLDNWQSMGQNAPLGRLAKRAGKKGARGLNENYGRELLELHTLGVDGGYTQQDVIDVARCFTGWTIRDGKFQFAPGMHDSAEKTVLGVKIPAGGGKEDAQTVLDIVSRHQSTAKFVSLKLAQRFVSDTPSPALVNAMAATFLKSDGNLRDVMKTMLNAKEFWAADNYRAKIKSPMELVVSAARAGQAELKNGLTLAVAAEKMGQPVYRKLEPTGYSNVSSEWKNSASLMARMNLASAFAQNKVPGLKMNWPDDAAAILSHKPSASLKQTLSASVDKRTAVEAVLGSPEFQKR
ncbi:MAG: DUF1800 domain-containing protein [Bryobacteraceae bacterium]|nr:DUF1800 domain-containing protein [Bryobacteraceae bacterium]